MSGLLGDLHMQLSRSERFFSALTLDPFLESGGLGGSSNRQYCTPVSSTSCLLLSLQVLHMFG